MIEQGFVQLIQTGLAGQFTPNPSGGYAIELPKDIVTVSESNPKAWTWRTIARTPTQTLQGQTSLTSWRVCIDCHGTTALDAIQLWSAIDKVLRVGFPSTPLSDPDSTKVCGLFALPGFVDGYSDTNRTFVRSVDYLVQYYQA